LITKSCTSFFSC